jgi:acyl carrier protein
MSDALLEKVRKIVGDCVGGEYRAKPVPDSMQLIGNLLDSMVVTKLVAALEEAYGFMFDDEDLSAEAFETVPSLAALVRKKVGG